MTRDASGQTDAMPSLAGDYLVSAVILAITIGIAVWLVGPLAGTWRVALLVGSALLIGMLLARRHVALKDWARRDTHLTSLAEHH